MTQQEMHFPAPIAGYEHLRRGEKLVSYVAGSRRKPNAARLAPNRFVDLVFIPDLQATRGFTGNKDCIAHFSTRATIRGLHFFPKADRTKSELW